MFGRKPQLPVSSEQQAWLEQGFQHLIELFGVDWVVSAPLVLPSEEFFPQKWEPTEAWATFAFGQVCSLMHVPPERVVLAFIEDPRATLRKTGLWLGGPTEAAGTYNELAQEGCPPVAQIRLKISLFERPEVMVAVMAHELAHVLLLGGKKIEREMEKMEELTDLMTIFSGFGIMNANAAHFRYYTHRWGWLASGGGYLTERDFAYGLALFAWTRREYSPSWSNELNTSVRTFMRDTLAHFNARGRAN